VLTEFQLYYLSERALKALSRGWKNLDGLSSKEQLLELTCRQKCSSSSCFELVPLLLGIADWALDRATQSARLLLHDVTAAVSESYSNCENDLPTKQLALLVDFCDSSENVHRHLATYPLFNLGEDNKQCSPVLLKAGDDMASTWTDI